LRFLQKTDRLIASILCWLIIAIRPLLGTENICPFEIGCTNFALFNLQEQSVPFACFAILKRLLICNPMGIFTYKIKRIYSKS
jgi:putative component of membrane protein insertase Oxa1/YidC/SpoIIIJ protein YidD